jgi:hypothetical protein
MSVIAIDFGILDGVVCYPASPVGAAVVLASQPKVTR